MPYLLASLALAILLAAHLLLRRRAPRRVVTVRSLTAGQRAFNAYRLAGDSPGRTRDGVPIPQWSDLAPVVRRGWAAFAGGVDAIDGYERYRTTVRDDRLGRPIPLWLVLDDTTRARWEAAFSALVADEGSVAPPAAALLLLCFLPACNPAQRAQADATARGIAADCLLPAVVPAALDALGYLVSSLLGGGEGKPVGTEAGWAKLGIEAASKYGLPAVRCAVEHLAGPMPVAGVKVAGDEATPLPRLAARWMRANQGAWAVTAATMTP